MNSGLCIVDYKEMVMDREIKDYRDLLIWQKGIALVKEIYLL